MLDTNVLIAGTRSRNGASFQLLTLLTSGRFEISLSVPLVLEYEEILQRQSGELSLDENDRWDLLDFLCHVGHHQEVFYLWRPHLGDPDDDMILELAVASRCLAIVTHNTRDFSTVARWGLRLFTPQQFLHYLGEQP